MPCRSPSVVDSQARLGSCLHGSKKKKVIVRFVVVFLIFPFLSLLLPSHPARPLYSRETVRDANHPVGQSLLLELHCLLGWIPGWAVSAFANEQSASILIWCGCILVDVKFRFLVLIVIPRPFVFRCSFSPRVTSSLRHSFFFFFLLCVCVYRYSTALPSFAIYSVSDFYYDHFLGGAGISELNLVPGWTGLGALSFF